MKYHEVTAFLPITPARMDVYNLDEKKFDKDGDIEVNIHIHDINVVFEEVDFWMVEILDAVEVLDDGREIELTKDEIAMVCEQCSDDLAGEIDPSDYYPGY